MNQEHILIVEDEELNVQLLTSILEPDGYRISAAANGTAALELVESDPPDLILLDIMLPEVDGFEVCRRLKAGETTRDIPVVMITALSSFEDRIKGIECGADDYITKPYQNVEVLARTRSLLKVKALRDEATRQHAELEHLYRELSSAEEMRRQLTRFIVHDLKNPLTIIQANLSFFEDTLRKDNAEEGLLKPLSDSRRAGNRLLNMIQNLLDIERMEGGKLALKRESVDISEVFKEAVAEYLPLARRKEIDLCCDVVDPLPVVKADRDLIRRVVDNLLGNALQVSPSSSTVKVEAEVKNEELHARVIDGGPGVPDEFKEYVFEKFAQLKERVVRERSGRGLGLTFCRMAVEAHGGRIWVEDAGDVGSVFTFTLPCTSPTN